MLSAGIPIIEAIDSLIGESKGGPKKLLEQLKNDLNQGKTVADSFAKSPKSFDPVSVSLIKASEEAGTLEKTLQDLKINIKKNMEFSEKVKTALLYPVIVMVVFSLVIFM